MTPSPVRVQLDLPDVVRAGLGALLAAHPDRVEVVGAADVERVDVEIFDPGDVHRPGSAGTGVAPRVALTWDLGAATAARARDLGAVLVVPLDVRVPDLVDVLEAVHRARSPESVPLGEDAPASLSPREVDVIRGIGRGLSNLEIAGELDLSVNSVKTYVRTAYRKMKVDSRSQAVLWGVAHDL